MSYDIWLEDPVTRKTIEVEEPHIMAGGTYAVGGTKELWLNITYNYGSYYYEVFDDGIRSIYGKTGVDSIPMLQRMIDEIEGKYKKDGEWISTKRNIPKYYDSSGKEVDIYEAITKHPGEYVRSEITVDVNEGPNEDYWLATAGNAIKPLYQLIAMAKMRPDGIWNGD